MSRDLLLLLLLCALVRLPWIFTVPAGEAPDEYTHLWMIQFLRDHLRLPTGQEVLAAGPVAVYGSLPPFGYLPHALLTRLVPESEVALCARFATLLTGLATVWSGWLAGRELFAGRRLLALALPLMLVFHPQLVFLHCYANNDCTAGAIAGFVIYLLIVALKRGPTLKLSLASGILLSWLALCKYSGWTIIPVAFAAIATACALNGTALPRALTYLAVAGITFTGPTAAWLFRNYQQFSGDWLGTRTMYHTWAVAFNRQLVYHISPLQVLEDRRWWRFFLFSYWGMFGYFNRYIWKPIYYIFLGFQSVALAGWLKALKDRSWTRENLVGLSVWTMLALCCLFNLAGMIYASTENLGGPQGRYMLISEIPVMALIVSGLSRGGERFGRCAVIALLVLTGATCVGAWLMLLKLYGWHLHP